MPTLSRVPPRVHPRAHCRGRARRGTVLAGLALLLAGGTALAAIDMRAQQQVQRWLDGQPADGTRLSVSGPVSAKLDGDKMRLTLPGAQLYLGAHHDKDKPGDGPRVLELGTLTVLVTAGSAGGWDLTVPLPPHIPVRDNTGAALGDLSAAKQSVRAHLTSDGATMDMLDVALGGVAFQPTPGHDAYTIATLTLRAQPDKVDAKHWSGPVRVAVADVAVHAADGGDWALRQGGLNATISDLDLAQAQALRAGGYLPASGQGRALDGLLSHLKATLALQDLSGRDEGGAPYALKTLDLSLNIDGDGSRVSVDYTHHGLEMTASDGGAPLPAEGRLRLVARDVPVEAVAATYLENPLPKGDGSKGADKERRHARQERRGHLIDDLAAAGTRINLDTLDFQSASVGLAAHGTLNFSEKDAHSLDGAINLRTRGLQALVGPKGGGAALTLFAFDALARPDKDDAGRAVRAYDVAVSPDGRILLNDKEATTLMLGVSKLF